MSGREEVKVKCCCDTCAHYPCDVCEDDPDEIDLTLSVCACWDPHPDLMDNPNLHNLPKFETADKILEARS